MRTSSLFIARGLAPLVCVVVAATTAAAEPVVLAVDGPRVYVDVGAREGVGAGTELELVRVVVATDPVTRRTLRDAFAIGTLSVTRAGDHVCEATVEPGLRGRIAIGDKIRLADAPRSFVDPWAEQVAASKRAPGDPGDGPPVIAPGGDPRVAAQAAVDAATDASTQWRATLGRPPHERAAQWRAFLTEHPTTPYAAIIGAEIESLDRQAKLLDDAVAAANAPDDGSRRPALADALAELVGAPDGALYAAVPTRVSPGRPIGVAFTQVHPVEGALWLYVRAPGTATYQRVALAADGDAYLRATIAAELVTAGALQWYVAAADRPVLGAPDAPRVITVERDLSEPAPARGRTQIHTALDYVDFDGGLESGFDQYAQAELDFAYQFRAAVHTARVGFGTMSGTGGPKDIIDNDTTGRCLDGSGTFRCRAVTFSYVYTEFEFRPRPQFALMVRPQAGLLTTDRDPDGGPRRCGDATDLDGCAFDTGLGLRVRARIGDEDGTSLELGAGFTDGVGTLFEAMYRWAPTPKVPVKLAVQVTDLPVPEDFGVRLLADVGWRGVSWVYPSLRVSYQARDIDHVGVSGGLGLNFDW